MSPRTGTSNGSVAYHPCSLRPVVLFTPKTDPNYRCTARTLARVRVNANNSHIALLTGIIFIIHPYLYVRACACVTLAPYESYRRKYVIARRRFTSNKSYYTALVHITRRGIVTLAHIFTSIFLCIHFSRHNLFLGRARAERQSWPRVIVCTFSVLCDVPYVYE